MTTEPTIGESERWMSALVGGMLVLSSLRRRDGAAGALFATGGAALIYRGVVGRDGFFGACGRFIREQVGEIGGTDGERSGTGRGERGGRRRDRVTEAGVESFPASDPPSFTPGSGLEGADQD